MQTLTPYLWVALGSALGGVARFALSRLLAPVSVQFPWSTLWINVLGSFVIGFFATLTLAGGRYATSENSRLFVMVGLCGGFTTFSSFSLQTFDLLRAGAVPRALANVVLSVFLCLAAVAFGHTAARRSSGPPPIVPASAKETAG